MRLCKLTSRSTRSVVIWFGVAEVSEKLRWAAQGRGKSGGIRVIYYWVRQDGRLLMLLAYPKSRKDTLTAAETATLRRLVKEL
jgi:hypothetical protein